MVRVIYTVALTALLFGVAEAGSCAHLNSCNGHGKCDTVNSKCVCYNGWGAASDIAVFKTPDCSQRSCPADKAWVDIPTGPNKAHALAECSNQGLCDRLTGRCRCFAGYEGEACQRTACPGTPACSGHGKCVTLAQLSKEANAEPFGAATSYGGAPDTTTWDEAKIQGCVCDSSWVVGYGAGQTQGVQYFGPDCSQRRCPSGDDPRTELDETDCEWWDGNRRIWRGIIGSDDKYYKTVAELPAGVTVATAATGTPGVDCGAAGNKCYHECSGRGLCDYSTGMCTCFRGYFGSDCANKVTVPVSPL